MGVGSTEAKKFGQKKILFRAEVPLDSKVDPINIDVVVWDVLHLLQHVMKTCLVISLIFLTFVYGNSVLLADTLMALPLPP